MTEVPEPAGYGLVMPFVVCKDQGGPYDSQSFVAGCEVGAIDTALYILKPFASVLERWVYPALVPQLDLVAMRHELVLRQMGSDESGEWVRVRIGPAFLIADDPA